MDMENEDTNVSGPGGSASQFLTTAQSEETEKILWSVLNTAVDGIILIDEKGIIQFVNSACCKIFGYGDQELVGQNVSILAAQPDKSQHDGYIRKFLETGAPKIIGLGREVTGLHKDGSLFPVDLAVSEVKLGERRFFTGITRDITRQKEAEDALKLSNTILETYVSELDASRRALQEKADELSTLLEKEAGLNDRLRYEVETKNKFFSIISHDLRSPFNTLLGMTEMLATMASMLDPKTVSERAKDVHEAGSQVYDLLENLLEWSRLQMERAEIRTSPSSLSQVVEAALAALTPMAEKKKVALQNRVTDATIVADPHMVQTVIRNLVINAVKFTPPGGVVSLISDHQDGVVQMTVADTGVGMSAAQLTNVFDLDKKHSTTGTSGERGTGLGLSLSREMVELNKGQIWAESVVNEGTKIHFTIPLETLN